jgi:Subtilase family
MSEVFDSQFHDMQDAFARRGTYIEVAYTPSGRVDYVYETGRLLVRDSKVAEDVARILPGIELAREQPDRLALRVLSIDNLRGGHLTVPQALDILDRELNPPVGKGPGAPERPAKTEERDVEPPDYSPVHITHFTNGVQPDTVRHCPATEPEVPCCCAPDEPCGPCPPAAADGGAGVVIGVCDSGLLADIASAGWLGGVTGEVDSLGPLLANGLYDIPRYCGHGTFIAGVARCEAPESTVYVANDYINGGLQEWKVAQQLQALIADQGAQVVNLSAGSYSRNDWPLLSFRAFEHGAATLVCAAGNDATYRKFWPAAFDWAVAVGALGADQRNRAWFSNYGDWVDVYTLGEGMVNAFATGEYTYKEPPKRPATQVFDGRARWSGTSFAAPLAAGLIAAEMSQAGLTASGATQAVLARARSQAIPGVGPALYPR